MYSEKVDVILIKGAPGVGKSQTAKSLTKYFPNGVRMEIDNLRSMVISVDWTNQNEHINILSLSTNLVIDFLKLEYSPIIVVDTFSGNKIINYIEKLKSIQNDLFVKIFGLYTSENELKKRIDLRNDDEFKDFDSCKKLNKDTIKFKQKDEILIDTTGLHSENTAKIIYENIMKNIM
jgi:tRNA A37 N6-isopentenylltransferase MiaA